MKKLIGAIGGCIAAYYVIDALAAVSMACAWGDLVKYGHMQAAHELDDTRATGGVRMLKKSHLLEDVFTYNDFLHDG